MARFDFSMPEPSSFNGADMEPMESTEDEDDDEPEEPCDCDDCTAPRDVTDYNERPDPDDY